jgi:hypothetical protein
MVNGCLYHRFNNRGWMIKIQPMICVSSGQAISNTSANHHSFRLSVILQQMFFPHITHHPFGNCYFKRFQLGVYIIIFYINQHHFSLKTEFFVIGLPQQLSKFNSAIISTNFVTLSPNDTARNLGAIHLLALLLNTSLLFPKRGLPRLIALYIYTASNTQESMTKKSL